MAEELIFPLRSSANPAQPEAAIKQTTHVVEEYIDQLKTTGQTTALDALTNVVLDRAQRRGQYFVQESRQHDG
jgi:hypothetical protein